MTTADMLNRIAAALQNGDQLDLDRMAERVSDLLIDEAEKAAWLGLIKTASESIDGAFR